MQRSMYELFSRSRNNVNNIIRIKKEFLSSYSKNPSKPSSHSNGKTLLYVLIKTIDHNLTEIPSN